MAPFTVNMPIDWVIGSSMMRFGIVLLVLGLLLALRSPAMDSVAYFTQVIFISAGLGLFVFGLFFPYGIFYILSHTVIFFIKIL